MSFSTRADGLPSLRVQHNSIGFWHVIRDMPAYVLVSQRPLGCIIDGFLHVVATVSDWSVPGGILHIYSPDLSLALPFKTL